MTDLITVQLRREQQQTTEARALAMKHLLEGLEKGDVDRVPAARRLITNAFKLISDKLEHTLKNTPTRTAGLEWLRLVGAEKASMIVLRKLISLTLRGEDITIQKAAISTGKHIIEEGMVMQAEKVNNLYMQKAYQYMQKRGVKSENHARLTMRAAVKVVMHESIDIDPASALQTAKWVVNSAMQVGLLTMRRKNNGPLNTGLYTLHEDFNKVLFNTKYIDDLSGVGMLMVSPPNSWEPGMIGGYLAPTRNPLARKLNREDHNLSRKGLESSLEYLAALNHMQEVPFEIDQRAISIVRRIWVAQGNNRMLSIPSINPAPAPKFPFESGWDAETAPEHEKLQFINWKHAKSEWYTDEKTRKGEASRIGFLLREGTEQQGTRVYAPTYGDWRGRMYYSGTPNPQGPDYSRAALRFFDKKPLGQDGLFWLKVHIANSFGQDKARFTERAKWVDDNMDGLVEGMLRPEDSDMYREVADYPVLAAVAVQELVEALDSGRPEDFHSGLPIHMDATCSGLQHYSAMLRDPVGGRYVNLFDEGQPAKADIYAKVLENVKVLLTSKLDTESGKLAALWLAMPLDRKLSKKPVMTYVYKATLRGVSHHAMLWLLDNHYESKEISIYAMGDFMAKLLFQAIADAVPAAANCMAWVCEAVRLSGRDKPFQWQTPIGTTVYQKYRQSEQVKVRIRTCNMDKVMVLRDMETLRLKKMLDAAAPNFIHSLDSAHAGRVVNSMADKGLQVVSIHDSIGTHAADVGTLHKVIRKEFVDMYTESDPLQSIVNSNHLELELPEKGNLDLNKVLDSEFFFC